MLEGKIYEINGNEPILLNDPSQVWVIRSGSMTLFAVTVKNGLIEGNRRYLCTISEDGALFGSINNFLLQHRQILAVPMGEATLLQLNPECFADLVANSDARAITWVQNWLRHLGSTLSEITMPNIQVKATTEGNFSLNVGQTFQPEEDIFWVQLTQGTVRFLGLDELALTNAVGAFPLTDKMWLEAQEGVQLVTSKLVTGKLFTDKLFTANISQISNSDTILTGLCQFHALLLYSIHLLDERSAQEELRRLQDRQRQNRQVTAEALGELASTLNHQDGDFFLEGTPLLVAAGAVGRAMGIKILPPPRSIDLKRVKEPLEAIVRASRIRMRRVLLRDNWWRQDCGPLVVYTQEDNRPMALLPISSSRSNSRYELFDPVSQSRVTVNERIVTTLSPTAYMFYRSLPDKVLKAWELLQFALRGRGGDLILITIASVSVTLLGMLTPQATAIIMDNAIPDSDKGLLLQIGAGLLTAALGTVVFQLVQGIALLRVESASDASTQAAVWDRLLNLPVSFFRNYTTGDLQSRVSSVSTIRRQLSGKTLINMITGLFAFFYLGQLFSYNFQLALLALGVAVVTFTVTTISGLLLIRKTRPLLELQGNLFGQTVQLINGISKLHIAGAQERAFATWSKNYSRQTKLLLSTQQVEDTVVFFNTIVPILTNGILFWMTVNLLQNGQNSTGAGLSLGTFLAFNAAFNSFITGTTSLSNTVTETLKVIPEWKRTQPILQTIPEVDTTKADPGRLIGKIAVEQVNFRYHNDGPMILNEVSLSAEPGEFIALVGSSGSGKSTLFRLLLGFDSPEDGGIYYDGQDLSGLNVDAVRRQLGVVLQNGKLQSASIFENIASGANITLDEAWEAARMAGFADDVEDMPMGMHTVVSEGGGNLSGGQRQRLLIARALALKPRILLFDEATSALDNRTQAIVSESLEKMQVTRIAIAHRLSTIRNANRIYVLQAGRVVQKGSFDELAGQPGLFAQLMARQIG
jgi:NHLM bacteriocin system ABC transporter ATP-binding protein